jgi:hypothetical protein
VIANTRLLPVNLACQTEAKKKREQLKREKPKKTVKKETLKGKVPSSAGGGISREPRRPKY